MAIILQTEGVSPEVAEKILSLQDRCVNCGSTYQLQLHHRVFRGEGEEVLKKFLEVAIQVYKLYYGRELEMWGMNDIQQLVVLCQECHEGVKGVHGNNQELRNFFRKSFTCPITGFNIPFKKYGLFEISNRFLTAVS
jgi:5-methylcytosine-specific restriction endonuclease McrA